MKRKGRLEGKAAIVTASTSGIGRGIAVMFAREGARVIVNGRDEKRGREVLRECRKYSRAELVLGDVSSSDIWKRIRNTAIKKFGKIDILVNNAAYLFYKPALDITEEQWDTAMAVNLKSAWLGAKHCLPSMIKQRQGNIINISSVMGINAGIEACSYATSKGGMNLLSLSLAADYGKYTIRVNTISPGPIKTGQNAELRNDPKFVQNWLDTLYLKFLGIPEDVAYGAVYLASDEARFVTGANLVIDGGWIIG